MDYRPAFTTIPHEHEKLEDQINSLGLTFQSTFSEAILNYDDEQIQASLIGLYRTKEIFGISVSGGPKKQYRIGSIIDKNGIRSIEDSEKNKSKESADFSRIYDVLYTKTLPLYSPDNQKTVLGKITLYYSSVTVLERTYQTFLLTLISAATKTLALWLIAYFVINRLISKPIRKIQNEIINLDINLMEMKAYTPPSENEVSNENEFYLLKSCFEMFCWELKNKNLTVQKHTNNLESLIEERTKELTDTLSKLEENNRAKSNFLCQISHELRTPLNAIIGFSRRIHTQLKGHGDKRVHDGLWTILQNGEHLLCLINDLLDAAKSENAKLELHQQTTALQPLLDDIKATMDFTAQSKHLDLNISPAPIEFIYADPQRLKQILLNLISNALKFTEHGSVYVQCHLESYNNTPGILFNIIDSGLGIAEEDIARIFIEFEQLGNVNNKIAGTGLGLSIVRKLVTLHQGTINVSSKQAEGSEFKVWLPLKTQNNPKKHNTNNSASSHSA